MDRNMRKLLLRASLDKIVRGESIGENAETCITAISLLLTEIDEIIHVQRYRESSDWTSYALKQAELERIGNYIVKITDSETDRVVSFYSLGKRLEFVFTHNNAKPASGPDQLVQFSAVGANNQELTHDLQSAINRGLANMESRRSFLCKHNEGAKNMIDLPNSYHFKTLRLIEVRSGLGVLFGKKITTLLDKGTEKTAV